MSQVMTNFEVDVYRWPNLLYTSREEIWGMSSMVHVSGIASLVSEFALPRA